MNCQRLFQEGRIGTLRIKNRLVMPPMGVDFANHDGTASERMIKYYEERARGGVGLIINEYCGVDEINSVPALHNFRLSRDWHVNDAERLTEAVHRHHCHIFVQLHHGGSTSKPAYSGRQSLAPSAVAPTPGAPVPRAMTLEEVKEIQQKFVEAAVRAHKAGYDGVELHGAHSYLIGQFFSPYYNQRDDQYGGSFENRMRFIDEIIVEIRKRLGPGYPLTVRICGDEMTPDVPKTLNLEDGLQIGRHLEKMGIDAISISNGSALNPNANCDPYSYQPGWKKHVAKAFKACLSIPVIATNTVKDPDYAESLLAEGVSDFVAIGRALFADPDFPNKARTGRAAEIRTCIGCMFCRERLLSKSMAVACAVNPQMGREYQKRDLTVDGQARPVAVVGGGPGGLEAAITLAERGFQVTLFEKADCLGGTLNLASKPPHKALIASLIQAFARQAERLKVDVRLNCEATPETVAAVNPVGVFLAAGAKPITPELPGLDGPNVCTAEDVVGGRVKLSGRVVVVGTGLTGLETAEMLAGAGCQVALADMLAEIGPGIFPVIRNDILGRLKKFNPVFLPGHKLLSADAQGVTLERLSDGQQVRQEAEAVVLSLGVSPAREQLAAFQARFDQVRLIGDVSKPGRLYEATLDGYGKALAFSPEK